MVPGALSQVFDSQIMAMKFYVRESKCSPGEPKSTCEGKVTLYKQLAQNHAISVELGIFKCGETILQG